MPPEFLELDPQIEALIARENAALGLAAEQPTILGWEGDAPQFAAAAAEHEGLSNGLFGGAAGVFETGARPVTFDIGGIEAHA